jgi:hypothetical protein
VSFKTDRLVALFPEVYAAREGDSLLHRFLDALGFELVNADMAVKYLLKSHWIDYASNGGLDGLGALFGVTRRLLPDGTPEGDDTFRPLVKSTVPSFIGGGTVEAIKGAVRAALGLPYDLTLFQRQLAGPSGNVSKGISDLVAGLSALVQVEEFSPKRETILGTAAPTTTGSTVALDLNFTTVEPATPRIEWEFTQGGGRHLSLVRLDIGAGILSKGEFEVPQGAALVLAGEGVAGFSASIGTTDVSASFAATDGTSSQLLQVPTGGSRWIFAAARAGEFDISTFDRNETFNAAAFTVRMEWIRYQPLMFDVVVPYFVDAAVKRILAGTGYENRFRPFRGLSLDAIQRVVESKRAAGVRGMVQYSLSLPGESSEHTPPWEDQGATEAFSAAIEGHRAELHDAAEDLLVGALDSATESHYATEHFAIGGVFNVAVFDRSFGFE